jgi:hypothetical protein
MNQPSRSAEHVAGWDWGIGWPKAIREDQDGFARLRGFRTGY